MHLRAGRKSANCDLLFAQSDPGFRIWRQPTSRRPQHASALPARAPSNQIAQATGSEAPPLILEANVDAQSGERVTTVTQAPSVAAAAPNVKDQSPNTISKILVHETMRLKDDATGWAHKWQELELDLKLQLDLKKNQDVEVAGRDVNSDLPARGILGGGRGISSSAAGRLEKPNAEQYGTDAGIIADHRA
jgi:hypothetical protein